MPHSRFCDHTQSLSGVFINDRQHLITATIAQLVMNKVYAPDVTGILGAQSDDRTVFVIQPFPFLMAMRQLQTLFPPQPFNLLVINHPAFHAKQLSNLAITISTILLGQSDH